jgi:dephospho-CoA kinase
MLRLALTGGLMSGKSSLARYLVNEHGFHYVNYTDLIKEFASVALAEVGMQVSVADIHADKERYRPFLIALATLLDFDHGYGIDEIVKLLDAQKADKVVFDNCRFDPQFEKLQAAGFRLVRITTPYTVRLARGLEKGMTKDAFDALVNGTVEVPLRSFPGEVRISVDGDMDAVCNTLSGRILKAEMRERRVRRAAAELQPVAGGTA